MTHLQSSQSPSKSPKIYSVLRVDKEVDFVLDEDDITYLATVPGARSIEKSRKNFPEENITYNPCISYLEPVIESNYVTNKKKKMSCSSNLSPSKSSPTKRKSDTIIGSSNSIIANEFKKNCLEKNEPLLKNSGSELARAKLKTEKNKSCEPDVKVLSVVTQSSLKSSVNGKRVQNHRNGIRGKTMVSKFNGNLKQKSVVKQSPEGACNPFSFSSNESTINEADTAPLIGPVLFPDMSSNEAVCDVTNRSQIKSPTTNEATDFALFSNGSSSSKESPSVSEKNDASSEIKTGGSRPSKELHRLLENLNEIRWAHENSFKKLLNNEEIKNTRKTTGKSVQKREKRILENIKEFKTKKHKTRERESKIKVNPVLKAKSSIQNKNVLLNIKQRNLNCSSMVKHADKIKKRIYHDIKMKAKNDKVPSTKSKLRKPLTTNGPRKITKKPNIGLKSKVNQSTKEKEMNTSSRKNKILKPECNSANKKIKHTKSKIEPKRLHSKVAPKQNLVTNLIQNKEMEIVPETSNSSIQKFRKKLSSAKSETCTVSSNKTTILKNFEKVEFSNQIDFFKRFLDEDANLFSALQKGSKLRVTLEPLEHTSHWNSTFYEEFKNQVLTQALCKTLERENQDSFHSMFRNLDEAVFDQKNDVKISKKKKTEEESLRSSVRQIEGSYRYKEIVVKKHKCYMQIVIVPNVSKKNCLTIETMKELKEAFLLAKKDTTCRAILLSSSGPYFCGGIDFSQLIGDHKKQMAEEMSLIIRDLVIAISLVSKPIIAAVNGNTTGFGISILALCDIVLASDKATFCVPATKIGYIPEGGLSLTLPQVIGSGVATELLLQGRRFTAEQALRYGLVSEIIWPTSLMNEIVPRLDSLVSHPFQAMEATKTMVRGHLWDKLRAQVEKEWRMLPPLWLGADCQRNFKRVLKTGWLVD